MASMLDYMLLHGQESFRDLPFGPVDALVFSQLSYLGYEGGTDLMPARLTSLRGHMSYGVRRGNNSKLFDLASSLPRYKNSIALMYVYDFSEKETLQFSAVSFLLEDGTAFVSFRGTDSTLVGWKEDFMLSFTTPVPAQIKAKEYLDRVSEALMCPLRVGGHSKGGNLAVYAAAFCGEKTKDRIMEVYSNDGPGFEADIIATPEYQSVKARVNRFIPESSAVGILMEHDSNYTVVQSASRGFYQHDPFSWKTKQDGFVTSEKTSFSSDVLSESQRDWFRLLDDEERRFLTDTIFGLLAAGQFKTVEDMFDAPRGFKEVLAALRALPEEDKKKLPGFIKVFFTCIYDGGSRVVKKRMDLIKDRLEEMIRRALMK
ncbi:MAG: DUF2974 domain-containing protein [Clostridia bacterium]|nr:DUF2974 domain-containing protein [Clostridia bacterium]